MATTVGNAQILIGPELNSRILAKTQAHAAAFNKQLEKTLRPEITPGINAVAYRQKLQALTAKKAKQEFEASLDAIEYKAKLKALTAKRAKQEVKADLDSRLYQQKLRLLTARAATQEVTLQLKNEALYKARVAAATRPAKQTVNLDMDRGFGRMFVGVGANLQAIRGKVQVLRSAFVALRPVMLAAAGAAVFLFQALAQMVPTLAQAASAALALGPALASIAQGAAAAVIGFSGIGAAVKEVTQAQTQAASTAQDSADKIYQAQRGVQQAARGVEMAQRGVVDAQRGVVLADRGVVDAHRGVELAGRAMADAHRGVELADRAMADAHRGVEMSARGVADAHRAYEMATRNVADAQRGVILANREVESTQHALKQAEDSLASAQRNAKAAQEGITAARKEAVRQIYDLRISLAGARLDEEGATLAVERARLRLNETIRGSSVPYAKLASAQEKVSKAENSLAQSQLTAQMRQNELNKARLKGANTQQHELKVQKARLSVQAAEDRLAAAKSSLKGLGGTSASALEIKEADLAYRQSKQTLIEVRDRLKDVKTEYTEASKKGVEGSDQVRTALEQQGDAQRSVLDAQHGLKNASDAISDAQYNQAKAVIAVRDAQYEQTQAALGIKDALYEQTQAQLAVKDAAYGQQQAQFAVADAAYDQQQALLGVEDALYAQQQAQVAVQDAQYDLQEALIGLAESQKALNDAMTDTGGADSQTEAYDKLGAAGKRFVMFIVDELLPRFKDIRNAIQENMLPKFETAIRNLFPVIDKLGESLADTGTVMGDLAVKASEAFSTQEWLRDIETIGDAQNRMLTDLGGTTINLIEIMKDLWVAVLPQSERFTGWLEKATGNLKDMVQEASDDGRLAAFFERAGDAAAQWGRILGNVFAALFYTFKAITPMSEDFTDNLEDITERWKNWTKSDEGQEKVQNFFKFLRDLPWERMAKGFLIIAGAMAAINVTRSMFALLSVMGSLPGLLALGVAGLVAGFSVLYTQNEDFRESVNETARVIGEKLGPGLQLIGEKAVEAFEKLEPVFQTMLDFVEDFAIGLGPWLDDIAERLPLAAEAVADMAEAFEDLSAAIEDITGKGIGEWLGVMFGAAILTSIQGFTGLIKVTAQQLRFVTFVLELLKNAWLAAWGEDGWAIGAWNTFKAIISTAWAIFTATVFAVWNTITSTISSIWNTLWNTVTDRWNTFRSILSAAWAVLSALASSVWNTIKNTITSLWDTLWNIVTDRWNTFKGLISGAWEVMKQLASSVWNTIKDTITSLWDALWNTVGDRWATFRGFLNTAWEALKTFVTETWETIKDTITGLWQGLWDKVQEIWNGVTSFFTETIPGIFEDMKETIKGIWEDFLGIGTGLVNGFIDIFKALPGKIETAFNSAIEVLEKFGGLIKKIPGVGTLLDSAISSLKAGISIVIPDIPNISIPGLAYGGHVKGPGTEHSDSIHAKLSKNEFVQPAKAVHKYGLGFMEAVRAGTLPQPAFHAFQTGGLVGAPNADITAAAPPATSANAPSEAAPSPQFPAGPGSVRGDSGVWPGIVALIEKWGNPDGGSFSNAYRAGDPLWHGSGLAVDWGGFNQDKLAGMFMAIRPSILELIHSTDSANYGISRGQVSEMGSQLWAEHKNHIHVAMTQPSVEHYLGASIPTAVAGMGGAAAAAPVKTWMAAAQKIWDGLKGGFNNFLKPLDKIPFGPPIKKMVTSVPDKLLGFLDEKDPGQAPSSSSAPGGTAAVATGPPPAGAIPAYFTYFGSNPAAGFTDPNDAPGLLTASGVTADREGFSAPFWPLGTVADLTIGNKTKRLTQIDFGPALFVVDRHPGKAVLDFTWTAMQNMLGTVGNYDGFVKVVSFGTGRTYPGDFRPQGFDAGGMLEPGHYGGVFNATGGPEPVLTSPQWAAMFSIAENVGELVSQPTELENHLYIDGKEIEIIAERQIDKHDGRQAQARRTRRRKK